MLFFFNSLLNKTSPRRRLISIVTPHTPLRPLILPSNVGDNHLRILLDLSNDRHKRYCQGWKEGYQKSVAAWCNLSTCTTMTILRRTAENLSLSFRIFFCSALDFCDSPRSLPQLRQRFTRNRQLIRDVNDLGGKKTPLTFLRCLVQRF
jgi:hypothetical protein